MRIVESKPEVSRRGWVGWKERHWIPLTDCAAWLASVRRTISITSGRSLNPFFLGAEKVEEVCRSAARGGAERVSASISISLSDDSEEAEGRRRRFVDLGGSAQSGTG